MYVDRNKSAADNMLALINTTNGTTLTYTDFKLDNPVSLPPVYLPKADPDDPNEPQIIDRTADNTSIKVTGQNDYTDVITMTYRRLDLDFEVQYLNYQKADYTNWTDFLTKFAVKNDILVAELQFSISALPTTPGVNQVTVTPVPNSKIYFGTKIIRINV